MLTQRQHDLLHYLNRRIEQTGVCPSYDQAAEALRLKSRSSVHRLVEGLVERGFLRRAAGPSGKRGLEVIRLTDNPNSLTPGEVAWCRRNPERVRAMMQEGCTDAR